MDSGDVVAVAAVDDGVTGAVERVSSLDRTLAYKTICKGDSTKNSFL